jgi:hypothetical protein
LTGAANSVEMPKVEERFGNSSGFDILVLEVALGQKRTLVDAAGKDVW